jgi:putative nucleotidyltransferase with HDIG domain
LDHAEILSEQLRTLPVRAGAAVRLLQLLDDPDVSAGRLAEVIETDPSLTARMLQLANSPFYGIPRGVSSVTQATVVLGLSVVRAFAAGMAAGVLTKHDGAMPNDYWEHSMAAAAACAIVARRLSADPGEAMTVGLLHDLGAALLFRTDQRRFRMAERGARASSQPMVDAERDAFGLDHAAAGAVVLDAWRLPERLVTAIGEHHAEPSQVTAPLSRIVIAGNALAHAVDPPATAPMAVGLPLVAVLALVTPQLVDVHDSGAVAELLADVGELTNQLGACFAGV